MIKEYNYTSIREILSRVLRHPMLKDFTLEQAVYHTIDFIGIFGMPKLYQDKEVIIPINDYRGLLPCDLVSINQVKDCNSSLCLRSMTNTFLPNSNSNELSFKTQGRAIYTSFKTGEILVSYKSIPVDEDGYPLIIDNSIFIKTLESYIKKEAFNNLFDEGKITAPVLQKAEQNYAWLAGQLQREFTMPSISEMESIKNMWCSLLQRNNEFEKGFSSLGRKEYIKVQ